jgi:ribosomal protein S18 acetylase RimI-like enzyme
MDIVYTINKSSQEDIYKHLQSCDEDFIPKLSSRVSIKNFSEKIKNYAVFFEAWNQDILVGMVSGYFNNEASKVAFINNVSVLSAFSKRGIARQLLSDALKYAASKMFLEIHLEVNKNNTQALEFYSKNGFHFFNKNGDYLVMKKYCGEI